MKYLVKNQGCRICKSTNLIRIFRFGPQPPANSFLKKSELNKKEAFYPLDVYFCQKCHLVQLKDIVSPKILFRDYVYVSSTSPVFIKHFKDFGDKIIKRFDLTKKSLVVDIGSNDGILLKPYAKRGVRVLGIEPVNNIAQLARQEGIDTISEFFNLKLVQRIKKKYGAANIISATNVFAHINDIDEVAEGVRELLDDEGVFIIEAPYLIDFLEKNLFDTVYHEHLSYLSLSPLITFFEKHNMRVFDAERVSSHGGSLRVYVAKKSSSHKNSVNIARFIQLEKAKRLHELSTYQDFARRIENNKIALLKLLKQIKREHKQIVGYGAPAKGNTLLNYFDITTDFLDFIVDDSVYKQELYTPGTHIPVTSAHALKEKLPNYILILAWNFAEEIIKKNIILQKKGTKFIIPVPYPQVI